MSKYGAKSDSYLRIKRAETCLTLDPARGGSIREFSWRGQHILRPTPPHAGNDRFELACFPLVPFANRIANGHFEWSGISVDIATNSNCGIHPLHGQGWLGQWGIAAQTPSSATLVFDGGENEWPWRYRSQQHFELEDGSLKLRLSVENLGGSPMPAVLGLHPYFCDANHARLQATTPRVWLADDESLPLEEVSTPTRWQFECARAINAVALDHCFTGWNGIATLSWPDRTVTMRASNCQSLHVYTPSGRDLFCVEPQTGPVGALNRGCHEAQIVNPGEAFAMEVSFELGVS